MIDSRKRIDTSDYGQMLADNNVVLALKFESKNDVKDIIEKMKNEILGLNLRTEGEFYVQNKKEDIQVHQLPPSTYFKSIQEMTQWAAYKYVPDIHQELGTISVNDDTIVLHLNHSVSDGKYFAGVVNHICDETQIVPKSYFPITFDEEFSEEIKERLKSPPKFYDNDVNNTIFSNFGMKRIDCEKLHDCICDVKTFANYDLNTKKCKNLTAAIVTGYSLSLSALDRKETISHLGGSLAVDMRNVLKEKKIFNIANIIKNTRAVPSKKKNKKQKTNNPYTMNQANFFSIIPIAIPVSSSSKISECYKKINDNINTHTVLHKEDLFDLRCSMGFKNPKEKSEGVMAGFSNLGPIHIKSPIKDLYLFNLDFNIVFPYIILFSYSIIDERNNRNELHAQVRYECNGLTKNNQSFCQILLNITCKYSMKIKKLVKHSMN